MTDCRGKGIKIMRPKKKFLMLLAFARRRGTLEIPLFPRASWFRHRCSVLAPRQEGTECVKDAGVTMLLDGAHRKKKLRSDKKNHLMACAWKKHENGRHGCSHSQSHNNCHIHFVLLFQGVG